jgi:hypothetical protein
MVAKTSRETKSDKSLQAHNRQDEVSGILTGTALVQRSCTLDAHGVTSNLSQFPAFASSPQPAVSSYVCTGLHGGTDPS